MLHPAPKPVCVVDFEYRRFVRTQPCCVCEHVGAKQLTRTEAHHLHTRGAGGGDDTLAPFCTAHHQLWHLLGRKSFQARVGFDPTVTVARLWAEWRAQGWPTGMRP